MDSLRFKLECVVISSPEVISSFGKGNVYEVQVQNVRKSGKVDTFLLDYKEGDAQNIEVGSYLKVEGQVRTRKELHEEGNVKRGYLFASSISVLDEEPVEWENEVTGVGTVANDFKVRSHQGRNIGDLYLKNERSYNRVSYIYCSIWSRENIEKAQSFEVGDRINVVGRLQSINYHEELRLEVSTFEVDKLSE